jgi:hypothetical protein
MSPIRSIASDRQKGNELTLSMADPFASRRQWERALAVPMLYFMVYDRKPPAQPGVTPSFGFQTEKEDCSSSSTIAK